MLTLIQIMEVALPVLYAGIFLVYLHHFLKESTSARPFIGAHLLYGALGLHLSYLITRGIHLDHIPVSSRAEFLSLVAFCIALVYAFVDRKHGEANTGVFFLAMTVTTQAWSSVLMEPTSPAQLLIDYPIYGVHVLFTVLGFASLAVSALYALMYILLSRQLKSRNLGAIFRRLPPLSSLENMSRLATLCGIILLGIGLATGHFVGLYVLEEFNFLDPKIVITYVAWIGYAVGYLIVKTRGLSGLRMGYLALGAYLTLIAAMVIVNTFSATFHSFQ